MSFHHSWNYKTDLKGCKCTKCGCFATVLYNNALNCSCEFDAPPTLVSRNIDQITQYINERLPCYLSDAEAVVREIIE